jgi:hypothetical protein
LRKSGRSVRFSLRAQKIEEIDKLRHLIVLQLNPKGRVDSDIERLVGEIVSMSSEHHAASDEEYRMNLQLLTRKTQELLKKEWEKVKEESVRGDLARKDDG